MSIENAKVIDFLVNNKDDNQVILVITDHLSWEEPNYEHAFMLQKKLNHYLAFIKDGQMDEEYPEHRGKLPVIQVNGKYQLDKKAKQFYEKAAQIAGHDGVLLKFEHSPEKLLRKKINP